jgi:hypothetical protein
MRAADAARSAEQKALPLPSSRDCGRKKGARASASLPSAVLSKRWIIAQTAPGRDNFGFHRQ